MTKLHPREGKFGYVDGIEPKLLCGPVQPLLNMLTGPLLWVCRIRNTSTLIASFSCISITSLEIWWNFYMHQPFKGPKLRPTKLRFWNFPMAIFSKIRAIILFFTSRPGVKCGPLIGWINFYTQRTAHFKHVHNYVASIDRKLTKIMSGPLNATAIRCAGNSFHIQ